MSSVGAALPTEIPLSLLCQFMSRIEVNDPDLELSESDVDALANHLDAVRVFFNSGLSTGGIPDVYLDMFRVLCSAFAVYSGQTKKRVRRVESENARLRAEVGKLKLENDRIAIQQADLSVLKTQISMAADANTRMQQEMQTQGEEAQRSVIQSLSRKLDMRGDIASDEEFVAEVCARMGKDVALCQEIVRVFDLAQSTRPETVVRALQDRLGRDIRKMSKLEASQHESEMAVAQREIDSMKAALTKERSRNKRLKEKVSVIPEMEEEKAQMIGTLRKREKEIRKLETCLSPERQHTNGELDKVMKLLDEMSEQSARQASELAEAVDNRSVLVAAIKKLLAANQQLEKLCEAKQQPVVVAKPDDGVIKALKKIASRAVVEACESTGSVESKVQRVVEAVNADIAACYGAVKGLESVVYGQVKFLNLLTGSRDLVSSVVLDGNSVDDAICVVKSQIARAQNFIHEHALGFVDDPCVFEELLKKGDTSDLMQMLERYLRQHDEPTTPEGQELFIMFVQAVSACDVLRRFAESTRQDVLRQAADLRNARAHASQVKKACDRQCRAMQARADAQSARVIESVRSVLRGAVLDGNAAGPILDGLEKLNEIAAIDDQEYISSLQKQISELQMRVADLSGENTSVLEQARADLSQVQTLFETLKRESEEKLAEKSASISRLEDELTANEAVITEMKASNSQLQALNEHLQEELSISNETHESYKTKAERVIEDLQNELSSSKADCEQLMSLTKEQTETSIAQEDNLETLHRSLSKLKSKNSEMKARFAERAEHRKAQGGESQGQIQRLSSKNAKAAKEAKSMRRKFTSVQNLSKSLESERNHLAKQLDNQQRVVTLIETQTKMQLLEKEREAREKIEVARSELQDTLQSFLVKVCKVFYEYVDVEQPITIESVLSFLPRVKADIEAVPWLRGVEQDMLKVKQQLRVDELSDVVAEIESIQDDLSRLKGEEQQSRKLKERVAELEAWIERIFMLCSPSAAADAVPVMQKRIEERIYTAVGEPNRNEVQSLRTQKQILTSPKYRSIPMPKTKTSLRHVIVAASFALRIKKAAGHMESVLGLPKLDDVQVLPASGASVFGQFVIAD